MGSQLKDQVIQAAGLMCVSARTAPKTRGLDDLEILVISDEGDLRRLADEMERMGSELGLAFFQRDAENVRQSDAVLLIGVKSSKPKELNCGGCGYPTCEEFRKARRMSGKPYYGPSCVFQLIDLGIAAGSAVKTASLLNIDNRIMYSVGAAALRAGFLRESDIALGIPLSAYGKSIYFDRRPRA
ncbi:MAG: DUF2148 domain-containing protein [Nitrososphaerota archaeon]